MRRLMILTAALLAAFVAAAGAAANSGTFTDPAGDAAGAPDITAVTVNDSATGLLQIGVTVTGLTVTTPTELALFFDTDRNSATGDNGWEYSLMVMHDSTGGEYDLLHWTGSAFEVLDAPSMTLAVSGDVYTFSLSKTELGSPASFAFGALAAATDTSGQITAADRAPDGGNWIYELTTKPVLVTPVIQMPVPSPAKPKAGKSLSVTFPVLRSDDSTPLLTGTMICDPSVNGKVIVHRESFVNGKARLAFTIPKSAKGKMLKVQVTIKLGTQSAHKVVTYRVS
jgi:hypothetical protein